MNYIIQHEGVDDVKEDLKLVKSYKDRLVSLLIKMLNESSKEIDIPNKSNNKQRITVKYS